MRRCWRKIEDFIEGFNKPTYRGMRINGVRVQTWSSQHGMSGLGMRGPMQSGSNNEPEGYEFFVCSSSVIWSVKRAHQVQWKARSKKSKRS
jgi:hypothetical protein